MALQTSAEHPAPVRQIANLIGQWIGRLGAVWVEGEVAQLTRRPGPALVFLTLRDVSADISVTVTCPRRVLDAVDPPVVEGARVVVHARPNYYLPRGTLSLTADDIRPVGIGALLAELERRKRLLAAEGLFAAERKRALPFLPGVVGLICGRASAAEHDVLQNARLRWPAVRFEVRNVPVQGPAAAGAVIGALRALDADPAVQVIVIARGGGSVEDLLPFSDEALVRAVAAARTPVVSAIGHEPDSPLLDLVADVRASTPTDAARRIVPDVAEEVRQLGAARDRLRRLLRTRLDREADRLAGLRSRPVLRDPAGRLAQLAADVTGLHDRARRAATGRLAQAGRELAHRQAEVRALSPANTLARGYAVLQRSDGAVVRSAADVAEQEELRARLAEGRLVVRVRSRAVGSPA